MPSLHWSMMSRIFSIRTSPESYASNAHRTTYPQSWIANTMAWNIGSYSASKGQLTKMLSLYLRFGAARGPRARTRPFGIDYFDLACDFLCRLFDGMRRFARTVDKRFLCNRRRFYRANSNSHKQSLRVSLGFVDTRAVKVKIGKRISARSIALFSRCVDRPHN